MKKNITPLSVFIANGKTNDVFYTDKKSNHVHAACHNYGRVATCEPVKVIEGEKVITLLKVTLLEN